jgi:hypothetical protein
VRNLSASAAAGEGSLWEHEVHRHAALQAMLAERQQAAAD